MKDDKMRHLHDYERPALLIHLCVGSMLATTSHGTRDDKAGKAPLQDPVNAWRM